MKNLLEIYNTYKEILDEAWSNMSNEDSEENIEQDVNNNFPCQFKDPEVYKAFEKKLGHPITVKEAKAIKIFDKSWFSENKEITSFDEFAEYFTNLKTIKEEAFWGCENLKSIEIPVSVTSIGEYVFVNCTNLKSINIPDSVTSIGKYAFYYCENLKNVKMSNSIETLEEFTFYACPNLRLMQIPDNIKHLAPFFSNYRNIPKIIWRGQKYKNAFEAYDDIEKFNKENNNLIEAWNTISTEDTEDDVEQEFNDNLSQIGEPFYQNEKPIGIVVIDNPLTIMDLTSVGYKEDSFEPILTNHNQDYYLVSLPFLEAKEAAKNYSTEGTEKGSWHLPKLKELKKIGFRSLDLFNFSDRMTLTTNYKFKEWRTKIINGLLKLREEGIPVCCYFDKKTKNEECYVSTFWTDELNNKGIDRNWELRDFAYVFNLFRIWSDCENSEGSFQRQAINENPQDKNKFHWDITNPVRLFHTVTPKEKENHFKFKFNLKK